MVFYLKYRPQTLKELDNTEVSSLIGKYLARPSIPHAFLFTGTRGTGKTSTARIIAKIVNCQKSKVKGEACGVCDVCLSIAKGENLDVLEIDAASNRGIDEIRDLREKIKFAPTNLTFKVYIIDEVHMLTTEAFNALLKTLEEPPKHALFILATTEAHKIPNTIISRCVRVDFGRAKSEDLISSLSRIVRLEKLDVEKGVLEEIANLAEGSFRDAQKMLEEVTLENKKLTLADLYKKTGKTEEHLKKIFMEQLQKKQTRELLKTVQNLSESGHDIKQFFLEILVELEQLLIASYTDAGKKLWEVKELVKVISFFSKSFVELKTAVLPTLPFELAIVEYCEGTSSETNISESISSASHIVDATQASATISPLATRWNELLEKLKTHNHSIVGVLRSCRPLTLENGVLTIEAAYQFHAERLSDPKIRDIIGKVVEDLLGTKVKVEVVIKRRS